MNTYASALSQGGKFCLAEPLLKQCLEACERLLGRYHPSTLETLSNLGLHYSSLGDLKQADQVISDVIERRKQAGLENTTDTYAAVYNLALNMFMEGRVDEASRMFAEQCDRARGFFGTNNPYTLQIQHTLVRVLSERGDFEKAETLARQTLEARLVVTPDHEGTGRIMLYLGILLVKKGSLDEAELQLVRTLEFLQAPKFASHPFLSPWTSNWLGAIHLARKNYAQAEKLLVPSIERILATHEISYGEKRLAIDHLVELYQALGKPDEMARWKKSADSLPKPAPPGLPSSSSPRQ
jgi:tetratricopeptide (TPR) repeat protein